MTTEEAAQEGGQKTKGNRKEGGGGNPATCRKSWGISSPAWRGAPGSWPSWLRSSPLLLPARLKLEICSQTTWIRLVFPPQPPAQEKDREHPEPAMPQELSPKGPWLWVPGQGWAGLQSHCYQHPHKQQPCHWHWDVPGATRGPSPPGGSPGPAMSSLGT